MGRVMRVKLAGLAEIIRLSHRVPIEDLGADQRRCAGTTRHALRRIGIGLLNVKENDMITFIKRAVTWQTVVARRNLKNR